MHSYVFNLLTGGTAALVASAAARALPDPTPGSPLYLWFYRFAHLVLANFDKVTNEGKPGGN